MRRSSRLSILFALLFALAVMGAQEPGHVKHEEGVSNANPAWTDLVSSMEKMHRAMSSVAPSGDSDGDFVRLMLPHHQAAIDMAKSELLFGKSPEMRRLAQEIIADQQSEIDLMHLWLKKHPPARRKGGSSSDSSPKED